MSDQLQIRLLYEVCQIFIDAEELSRDMNLKQRSVIFETSARMAAQKLEALENSNAPRDEDTQS